MKCQIIGSKVVRGEFSLVDLLEMYTSQDEERFFCHLLMRIVREKYGIPETFEIGDSFDNSMEDITDQMKGHFFKVLGITGSSYSNNIFGWANLSSKYNSSKLYLAYMKRNGVDGEDMNAVYESHNSEIGRRYDFRRELLETLIADGMDYQFEVLFKLNTAVESYYHYMGKGE